MFSFQQRQGVKLEGERMRLLEIDSSDGTLSFHENEPIGRLLFYFVSDLVEKMRPEVLFSVPLLTRQDFAFAFSKSHGECRQW